MPEKIDQMYAYIAQDPDGSEGITAFLAEDGWMPMVGADLKRAEALRPMAEILARESGRPIKLVRFEIRTELEDILP